MHITRFIISSLPKKVYEKYCIPYLLRISRFFSFKIFNIDMEQANNTSISRFKLISTFSSNDLHALAKSLINCLGKDAGVFYYYFLFPALFG